MMQASDIGTVLFNDLKRFNLPCYKRQALPFKELKSDTIIIITKELSSESIWKKSFVEVNFCVPDKDNVANLSKLSYYESLAEPFLRSVVGEFKGSHYLYSISSIDPFVEDKDMKCHFVNFQILFEILNID